MGELMPRIARIGGEWEKSSNSRLGSRLGGEAPRPTASHAEDPNLKLEKSLQVMVIYDGETNEEEEEYDPTQLEGVRGIEVASSPKGYLLSQHKYIGDLLDHARITYKMVEDIPIDAKEKYTPLDGDPLSGLNFFSSYCQSICFGSNNGSLGYCFVNSQMSKKQDVLSKSSTEAEYRAMALTTSEIVWLRWLLTDMGVCISYSTPLHCDNHRVIHIARNSMFHESTKHIENLR
nr:uncharacterized mitochondrial protein AtMg00810-like [Tanacetum cinerariifolium]